MEVTTEKELARALKNNEDTIVIEGNLASKTIKIKATGKVAWAVALGAISVSVVAILATAGTGGAAAPVSSFVGFGASGAAVGILGGGATYSAIAVAVAAGGVGVLNKLRRYDLVKKSENTVILKRKNT